MLSLSPRTQTYLIQQRGDGIEHSHVHAVRDEQQHVVPVEHEALDRVQER